MSTDREMRMPFGKFKGVPIGEIETSYLQWLHKNVDLREPLRSAVKAALSWKVIPAQKEPGGTTPAVRTSQEARPTAPLAASERVSGGSQRPEPAKPRPKTWIPRQEDLSVYYTAQGKDDIPW